MYLEAEAPAARARWESMREAVDKAQAFLETARLELDKAHKAERALPWERGLLEQIEAEIRRRGEA